jgi:hypothetical protein
MAVATRSISVLRVYKGRDHVSPGAPLRPALSADLSIMRAWLQAAAAAGEAASCRDPRSAPDMPDGVERCGACHPCQRYLSTVVTAVDSAVQRAQDGHARRVLGSNYYRIPERVRPLLGQPQGAGLRQLLGARSAGREGLFEPGLAGLTEREAQAYWLRIQGWSSVAIARELTHPAARYDRAAWVAVKTVYNLCWLAKGKVLKAFGLPAQDEPDEDWEPER